MKNIKFSAIPMMNNCNGKKNQVRELLLLYTQILLFRIKNLALVIHEQWK